MSFHKPVTVTAVAAATALALSACSDSGTTTTETNADTGAASSVAPEATESSEATSSATTSASETSSETTSSSTEAAAGDDPVFAAIDAVKAEYADGTIVDVDREDGTAAYDVDVVVGQDLIELEVAEDGTIREDEREGDDDDVEEAQRATVDVEDAITQALEQHPDGIVDEVELDEDDGRLEWKIDLDDDDRNDLAEVVVPAT